MSPPGRRRARPPAEFAASTLVLRTIDPPHPDGPGVLVVGELDLHTGRQLPLLVHLALDPPPPRTVLDLSRCTFLDSAGARSLVAVTEELAGRGAHAVLTGLRPRHRLVLEATGLGDRLHLDDADAG